MGDYKQILVAMDFDEAQPLLLERARDLAGRYRAHLTLLHVVDFVRPALADDMTVSVDVEVEQILVERAQEQLAQMAGDFQADTVDCRVESGVPKHEITRTAEALSCDLILIGSHGRHGLQLLLGSTANGVIHLATCDVLAVRCPTTD